MQITISLCGFVVSTAKMVDQLIELAARDISRNIAPKPASKTGQAQLSGVLYKLIAILLILIEHYWITK